jgi:formate hydrogenlyase subunit 3/multisubunit Na+/H+ antiporter MnhD subunit
VNVWIEAMGWIGALLILAAYALISAGKLEARSALYQLMNIAAAAGLVVNSGWNGALPSAALNVVWLCIGLYTLLRDRRANKPGNDSATGSRSS